VSQAVRPEVFLRGTQYDMLVSVQRTVTKVEKFADVPTSTHIRTTAGVWYEIPMKEMSTNRVTSSPPEVPADVRAAAIASIPELRGLPSRLLEQAVTEETEFNGDGVAAVVLIPTGLVLLIPSAIVIPVLVMRHRARRRLVVS
jgi:hypothetical protein